MCSDATTISNSPQRGRSPGCIPSQPTEQKAAVRAVPCTKFGQ